jgi:UbiD family decarboxylase
VEVLACEVMALYADLREYLALVEGIGELRRVEGADWNVEIGTLTEVAYKQPGGGPLLLFDDVAGYPSGYRVATNVVGSLDRLALAIGLPLGLSKQQAARAWHERWRSLRPLPYVEVADGPVFENVHRGEDVNLLEFPVPYWHEGDGGRFIGTGCVNVTRAPDGSWVNVGTYRVQVADERRCFVYISPGKQGRIHRDLWFERGEPCPVAVSVGHDPSLFLLGGLEVPAGVCEYDVCGALRGEPFEVVRSPIHGLPVPARAEIVLEGVIRPDRTAVEGPFGEWTGYFAGGQRPEPLMEVEAVYHRRDPILFGTTHAVPPTEPIFHRAVMRSGLVREALEKAGIPDVQGVWCHEAGGARLLTVVSIRQRYAGHARQAATAAAVVQPGAYLGRYVIVVDEDVDPSDLHQVMWAVCTRSEPAESIDILRRQWSGPLDPRLPAGRKGFSSRAVIDATRPFEWKDDFPRVCAARRDLFEQTARRWAHLFEVPVRG